MKDQSHYENSIKSELYPNDPWIIIHQFSNILTLIALVAFNLWIAQYSPFNTKLYRRYSNIFIERKDLSRFVSTND